LNALNYDGDTQPFFHHHPPQLRHPPKQTRSNHIYLILFTIMMESRNLSLIHPPTPCHRPLPAPCHRCHRPLPAQCRRPLLLKMTCYKPPRKITKK
jgi:hypothetical protein